MAKPKPRSPSTLTDLLTDHTSIKPLRPKGFEAPTQFPFDRSPYL
jgi:hypothetical protein